jgi:TRAP-type C4-dicarboxylate transport system substrate-binding protein
MKFKLPAACVAATLAVAASIPVWAQDVETRSFNAVGTWNFLTNWQKLEQPFWTEDLPKATGGKLKGNIKSITEVNLKGTEVIRLLKQGVFDFAAALPIYVEDGGAIIEASDIAGVARDFKMGRAVVTAWLPEMQKAMARNGAMILGTFPFPEQVFYCKGDIKSIADLKGKKVRVQGTSQSDFVAALGGVGVTIAFGEVVPALEKGVTDCGITGTMPGYKAKWGEVVDTMFRLPVGYTVGIWAVNLNTWNKLSQPTKDAIQAEMKKLEDKSWAVIEAETEEGVACNTGGTCSVGPAGKLKLVKPSAEDVKARDKALNEVVLARWAKRCGAECASKWNELVGKTYGLTAKAE